MAAGCTCSVTVERDEHRHSTITRVPDPSCPIDHSPPGPTDPAAFRWLLTAEERGRINEIRNQHGLKPLGERRDDDPDGGVPALLG